MLVCGDVRRRASSPFSSAFAPALLRPLNLLWFRFSMLLHRVVNPIVMFTIFAVVFVPGGLLMRLWRDPLRARRDPDTEDLLGRAHGGRRGAFLHAASVLTISNSERAVVGAAHWGTRTGKMLALLRELLAYMGARKKWWLLPIVVLLVVFGGLLILAQGSAIAPFIYTVF